MECQYKKRQVLCHCTIDEIGVKKNRQDLNNAGRKQQVYYSVIQNTQAQLQITAGNLHFSIQQDLIMAMAQ